MSRPLRSSGAERRISATSRNSCWSASCPTKPRCLRMTRPLRRVPAAVALPWLAAASDTLCRELSELARDKQLRLIAAAARSRDDAVASRRQHGRTEVKRLLDARALSAATIVAHAGWTSPRDLV